MVYCIHRREDRNRAEWLFDELAKVEINELMFIEPEPIDEDFVETKNFNKEMDSLRRTTISIIEDAIIEKAPYITIMEDDCKFHQDLFRAFQKAELPESFDFIHLNVTGRQVYGHKLVNKMFRPVIGNCCQYYIISSSVYNRYLTLLKNSMVPIDEVTRHLHKERGLSFAVEPLPVYHEPNNYSTLKGKIVKY